MESRELDRSTAPEVASAQKRLGAIEAAVGDPEGVGHSLAREGADPALVEILAWFPLFEREVDRKLRKDLKKFIDSDAADDWASVAKTLEKYVEEARRVRGEGARSHREARRQRGPLLHAAPRRPRRRQRGGRLGGVRASRQRRAEAPARVADVGVLRLVGAGGSLSLEFLVFQAVRLHDDVP